MAPVYIKVHRVAKGRGLQHHNFIAGQTAHFEQFQRNDIGRDFLDDSALPAFKIGYSDFQSLFRFNLNKAKVRQKKRMEKYVCGKELRVKKLRNEALKEQRTERKEE